MVITYEPINTELTSTDNEALDQLYRWLYERGIKRLQARQEQEEVATEVQHG
jgi:hypothetical protein